MLDILGENRFKVLAYRRASENILSLGQDIRAYWQAGTLQEIPGIGPAIADKIDELLSTGKLEFYERHQDGEPAVTLMVNASDACQIEGTPDRFRCPGINTILEKLLKFEYEKTHGRKEGAQADMDKPRG